MKKSFGLHWQIFVALILSVAFGILFPTYTSYVEWIGTLFLRGLKMVIIPLMLSSIISGVASLKGNAIQKLGLRTLGFYMITSTLAIVTGMILVNLIQPGLRAEIDLGVEIQQLELTRTSIWVTLLNIVPDNIFVAFTEANILSVIFFAFLFGFFLSRTEEVYKEPTLNVVNGVFEVMMKITMFIIRFTPLGIIGLVAPVIAAQKDIAAVASGLGGYFVTVLLALLFHAFVTMMIVLRVGAKVNPIKHLKAMMLPLTTAFSTSSSSATLPLTMETVENESGVSKKITSFTLPLGATVNMDGTALYECVAAIFIAQIYGMELTIVNQVVIVLTALLASVGAAGIPMAGLVMITIILSYLGLPLEAVGLIIAVDRPLDMLRTAVNVWGDTCCAVYVAKSENETLNYE
jgi:proton glutamate symport protein